VNNRSGPKVVGVMFVLLMTTLIRLNVQALGIPTCTLKIVDALLAVAVADG
jgi:hypothetical protein